MRRGLLSLMPPERASRYARIAHEINQSVTGYMMGNLLTSVIAGVVVFVTLTALAIPFPLLWAIWVAQVDFLPMVGGALAGIPTVLFALGHSLTAGCPADTREGTVAGDRPGRATRRRAGIADGINT